MDLARCAHASDKQSVQAETPAAQRQEAQQSSKALSPELKGTLSEASDQGEPASTGTGITHTCSW